MPPTSELGAALLLRCAGAPLERDKWISYDARVLDIAEPGQVHPRPNRLVMPPLANAHDHGRGLRPVAHGAADAPLECWVPATYAVPAVPPYLVAAAALGRMARSGIGHVVQCHLWRPPAALVEEARAVRQAADNIGVRVAFVVPLRDRHRLAYGPDAEVLDCMPVALRGQIAERFLKPIPAIAEQMAAAEEIAATCSSPLFDVQLGPIGVEWCTDALLEAVAGASERTGRRVHMHLLESRYQREWADAAFPRGIVRHLADIGLLSPRLTVAHGVWLRPDECELLAENGVTLSVNTSSNLRLRSGIAPLATMHAAGVRFALGLDALALDDDDDMLREMRLTRLLHSATGFEQSLTPADFLAAATAHGAAVIASKALTSGLQVGAPADLLALDLTRMTADLAEGLYHPLDIVHGRANASDVEMLVIDGRTIVQDGAVLGIDLPAVEQELSARLVSAAPALREGLPLLAAYQAGLRRFYRDGRHKRANKLTAGAADA